MNPESFFHVMEILLVAAIFMWFFARPWQNFCTDISRHRYFELRDQLFLIAANNRIGFDDPAYRALREWLNYRIRLAHINVFGDLIAVVIAHKGDIPKLPNVGDEIETVRNELVRSEMQSIYRQAIRIQLNHMAVRSPVFLVLAVLAPFIMLIELISGSFRACTRWLGELVQFADDDAGKQYIVGRG